MCSEPGGDSVARNGMGSTLVVSGRLPTLYDEQLHALRFNPRLHAVVVVFIYTGLRREE